MKANTQTLFSFTKSYPKLLKISVVFGLVLILSARPITVHAEDAEDLLNIYGLTLGKADASEIESEINQMEQDMLGMQSQQEINEEYNALLQLYIEKRNNIMNDVMEDVSVYQSNNTTISEYISANILDGDINTLLKYDTSYKSNNSDMNELLSKLNSFNMEESFKNVDFDTSLIEAKLADAKKLLPAYPTAAPVLSFRITFC